MFQLATAFKLLLPLLLSTALAADQLNNDTRCTFCVNGDPVTTPDKVIDIPGVPVNNCGDMDAAVPTLFEFDSETCQTIQSVGTLCGCEKRVDACDLCPDGTDLEHPNRELWFLADLFQGFAPTCEVFQAYLNSINSEDPMCSIGQSMLGDFCGCGSSTPGLLDEIPEPCHLCSDGSQFKQPNSTIGIKGFPFSTCGALGEASLALLAEGSDECRALQTLGPYCGCPQEEDFQPCSVCIDGTSPVPNPSATLDIIADQFAGIAVPCGMYESMVASFPADGEQCILGQAVGTLCGCAPVQNHCEICPGGIPEEHLNDIFEPAGISCELYEMSQFTLSDGSFECYSASLVSWYCGCNEGKAHYYGATNQSQLEIIAWIQRVSAIFSILGSLAIGFDVLRSKTKRAQVYNQIMLGISFFDSWSSISWLLGPIVTPPYFTEGPLYGYPTGVPGAWGTESSCKAFGFFLGWGLTTSILYNSALSLYYRKVIVDGWRNNRFTKRVLACFHGIPIFVGTSLALAGIPFYTSTISACTIPVFPVEEHWPKLLVFYWLPLGGSVTFVIVNTILVYLEVRSQMEKGKRWGFEQTENQYIRESEGHSWASRMSMMARCTCAIQVVRQAKEMKSWKRQKKTKSQQRKDMETIVFWQCFWYLLAFITSIPILFALTLGNLHLANSYSFNLMVAILGPLQGLNNAFVYFRPRCKQAIYSTPRRRRTPNGVDAAESSGDEQANMTSNTHMQAQDCDPNVAILSECAIDDEDDRLYKSGIEEMQASVDPDISERVSMPTSSPADNSDGMKIAGQSKLVMLEEVPSRARRASLGLREMEGHYGPPSSSDALVKTRLLIKNVFSSRNIDPAARIIATADFIRFATLAKQQHKEQ